MAGSVDGFDQVKTSLKAVAYSEESDGIKILSEQPVEKGKFEIRLSGPVEKQPDTLTLAVVPTEISAPGLIKRFVQAGYGPQATVTKDLIRTRDGKISPSDIPLKFKPDLIPLWPLQTQMVCGRVIKRDPVTGAECPVPGATVSVLDVDLNFLWHYPPFGFPYGWIYPFLFRREKIATVKTDECGTFCVSIPRFDIDAIIRWRLRLHCLWEILKPPTIGDVLDLGIIPDFEHYPDLRHIAEKKRLFRVRPKKWPEPDPDPLPLSGLNTPAATATLRSSAMAARQMTAQGLEALSRKVAAFRPVKAQTLSVLDRRAFPQQAPALPLPDDTRLAGVIPEKKMLQQIRNAHPIIRPVRCWKEIVPELQLFLDVPDIVFRVEQDIDGDGVLETIYDQGYFDINWNLSEPTTNVVIEAWNNAICVPCGSKFKSCTASGIVTINEMPVEATLLSPDGYARTINRPHPLPALPPAPIEAQTPFCGPLRLTGCPEYGMKSGAVKFYRMYYILEDDPLKKKVYFRESWYVWEIGSTNYPHVVPDMAGYYDAGYTGSTYAPYHTLLNWNTGNYPDGKYEIGLELYDGAKTKIATTVAPIHIVVDNSIPYPVEYTAFQYREGGAGSWNALPLSCAVIERTPGTALELKVTVNAAAKHFRDVDLVLYGCDSSMVIPCSPPHTSIPDCSRWSHWHTAVTDNNVMENADLHGTGG